MFEKAYNWMDKQYVERIKLPLDRDTIWVFYNTYFPYTFDENFDNEKIKVFVFDIPMSFIKSNFLWSDYLDWHKHLTLDTENENNFDIFDINIKNPIMNDSVKDYLGIPQGVTTRLNISWLKDIVNISPKNYKKDKKGRKL